MVCALGAVIMAGAFHSRRVHLFRLLSTTARPPGNLTLKRVDHQDGFGVGVQNDNIVARAGPVRPRGETVRREVVSHEVEPQREGAPHEADGVQHACPRMVLTVVVVSSPNRGVSF